MRIGELGRACGVSTATIKYYIREGLLPAGHLTSTNQARYTEDHLHRLRLIRALLELGGLSVAKVRAIASVLDEGADLSRRDNPGAGADLSRRDDLAVGTDLSRRDSRGAGADLSRRDSSGVGSDLSRRDNSGTELHPSRRDHRSAGADLSRRDSSGVGTTDLSRRDSPGARAADLSRRDNPGLPEANPSRRDDLAVGSDLSRRDNPGAEPDLSRRDSSPARPDPRAPLAPRKPLPELDPLAELEALTAPAPQGGPLALLAANPRTLALVDALAERRGWQVPVDSPEFARVVEVLDTLGELDQHHFTDRLDAYADAAERAAAADLELLRSPTGGTGSAERLVVAAVLGDQLLSALRRLARTTTTAATAPTTEKGRGPHSGCDPLPHASVGARYERLTSSRSRSGSAS
ncbi:MerR family transcriptional regulator [Streptomyces sp. NPDC090025]|uniref:MerR family transcriptional regulator n=1 Tax=Streptomyces sp. NPDC090025 TaxID=3365922 RepID=UPI003836CA65